MRERKCDRCGKDVPEELNAEKLPPPRVEMTVKGTVPIPDGLDICGSCFMEFLSFMGEMLPTPPMRKYIKKLPPPKKQQWSVSGW
jgi:hypothetical protein